MLILAITTSANFVSVALLQGSEVLLELDSRLDFRHRDASPVGLPAGAEDQLPPGFTRKRSKGSSRTRRVFPPGASVMLAPMIQQLLVQSGKSPTQIQLISVDHGPGMFTGLRVAVVTAKSLAYALNVPLIAVNTLAAIAAQAFQGFRDADRSVADLRCVVATNAQRRQLFSGIFRSTGSWEVLPDGAPPSDATSQNASNASVETIQIVDRDQWLGWLQKGDLVAGAGINLLESEIETAGLEIARVPTESRDLRASSVGHLARKRFEQGHRDDLWSLEPLYFRPSAAEEVRQARGQ